MAQRVSRGIALLFHDRGTRRGEWSAARPGRTLTPGNNRYPFYRRLGGPQGRSGGPENLVPPRDFFLYLHPYLLPYYCFIPIHTLFNLPRIRRTGRNLYCLSYSHRFTTPHHYPPFCFVNVCHCGLTLRSLLHVIAVYLMLQCHCHSPRPS